MKKQEINKPFHQNERLSQERITNPSENQSNFFGSIQSLLPEKSSLINPVDQLDSRERLALWNKSYAQLTLYEQYLDYKQNQIYLVIDIQKQVIKEFTSLTGKVLLTEKGIYLLTFLLSSIQYLTNLSLIEKFGLNKQNSNLQQKIQLPKHVIQLNKLIPRHRERLRQLNRRFLNTFTKINKIYQNSLKKRIEDLHKLFQKEPIYNTGLRQTLVSIQKLQFPEIESISSFYDLYFTQQKLELYKAHLSKEQISNKQWTLFYVLQYLIEFCANKEDKFYTDKDYLELIRKNIFSEQKKSMFDYIFHTDKSEVKTYSTKSIK